MERFRRMLCLLLCFVMMLGMVPEVSMAASTDDVLDAALSEALTYIDGITVSNSKNDPKTVVKNFKTHFTWDNEKRENSKGYLYDWSYYNGVVFEGIEYLYEVSGEEKYKTYVVDYMSSLVASDGTWAKCSNDSSKECAGYNSTHGADCYKTASLLLDAYEMTGDSRYLTIAKTLYNDLDVASKNYLLPNAGNNFRHTWASDSTPDLWLDGLYMILPFQAEYAKYSGDTEELNLIVSRMQWVSDNMYNSEKGLFYHAADSATSNSGTFWLRSIGWYAAAIVDIMDSMEGENLQAMKAQLVKLVNGMRACQNPTNGMWVNNMAQGQSSTNPYETSGTALVCYAVMKAVNNGWLDESYADMAILAFKGICSEKLNNNNLTDICFKGAPGSSNSTFYDNEGKGLGPFIMLYAEVLEYVNNNKQEPEVPETSVPETSVPETTVPETSVPETTVPETSVPETTAPVTTEPQEPDVTEPTITEPSEPQEPDVTEPTVTEPTVSEPTEPQEPEIVDQVVGNGAGVTATIGGVSGQLTAAALSDGDKALLDAKNFADYVALDVNGIVAEGETASVTFAIPAGWDSDRVVGIHIEDGAVVEIPGTVSDGNFTFEVSHFSGAGIALLAEDNAANTATGNLVSGVELLGSAVTTLTEGTYYMSLSVGGNTLTGTENGTMLGISGSVGLTNVNRWYIRSAGTNGYYYIQYGGPNGQYLSLGVNASASDGTGTCGAELVDTPTALRVRYVTGSDNGNYSCWVISRTVDGYEYYLNDAANEHTNAHGYYNQGWTAGTNPGNRWQFYPVEMITDGYIYQLDTDGLDYGEANKYLIVGSGNNVALTATDFNNTRQNTGTQNVTINNNLIILNTDDYEWYFLNNSTQTGSTEYNTLITQTGNTWLYHTNNSMYVGNNNDSHRGYWHVQTVNQSNGTYRFTDYDNRNWYLYYNRKFTVRTDNNSYVRLYKRIPVSNGEAVTFTVIPASGTIDMLNTQSINLTHEITLSNGATVSAQNITWTSDNTNVVVSSNGVVTVKNGVTQDTTATITATLNSVNGTALVEPIAVYVQINVDVPAVTFSTDRDDTSAAEASASVKVGSNKSLPSYVTVNGAAVPLENCEITWSSANKNIATVDNGVVTGVAEGETVITATLTKVNNYDLPSDIVLEYNVSVANKAITSHNLTGNTPVNTKVNVEPDFSDIELTIIYDDGTSDVITTQNGLVISGYDKTKTGSYVASISYNGTEYGTVRVTVTANPYEGLEDATDYPVYPEDGAVRIDKYATEKNFDSTGIVEVELNVAGVSVISGIDVILVSDLSNSMAWEVGTRNDATEYENTKVAHLAASISSFADTLLADQEGGIKAKHTMSLVTFGGYDADYTNKVYTAYADPCQTLVLGSSDAETIKTYANNIRLLADDALDVGTSSTGYYLSFDGGKTYGENYGNTNYDHAFMQTAAAIAQLKEDYKTKYGTSYENSDRQIFVVFMTDGAPSNYNGTYFNYKTGDRADVNCTWVNQNGREATYTMGNNSAQYQADAWYRFIAGGNYNAGSDTIPGNPLYWAGQVYNTPGVADVINVGFDLDNGGFSSMTFTQADGRPLDKVLENLVADKTLDVYTVKDPTDMQLVYTVLAKEFLRYAGTSTTATDVIGSDFTLQMGVTAGTDGLGIGEVNLTNHQITPTITIKAYDLYTKDETDDLTLIGTRKPIKEFPPQVLETVTFNAEGTEAYSDQIENGNKNILTTSGELIYIEGKYFNYSNIEGVETFRWKIGNITDKELALNFFAYLKGSLEGKAPKGLKYTNEEAVVEYIDINGKHATQTFAVPAVSWESASTAYEFYLVNDKGEPCDGNGNVIPFANRIIITGPYYEELYLNQSGEQIASEIIASKVLPAGYTLYDENAKYTVQTASIGTGKLTIGESTAGKVQTTILVSAVEPSYIQSRVAFGVKYRENPAEATFEITSDAIVIDYGKQIIIDVKANDTQIPQDVTATLVGFSKFYDNIDPSKQFASTSFNASYEGTYGTFSVTDDQKVSYVPHRMIDNVGKIFCVFKLTKGSDTYYMVSELDVIPATIMYYETDFATGVFTTTAFQNPVSDAVAADGPQDDGTIGQNTYGFDTSYENDAKLSNGSSLYAEGAGASKTVVTFSFTGTGFDLISRTGAQQGLIKVQIYTNSTMSGNAIKTVSVLNKSESNLELYQIPVVSVNGLEHGTYYVKIGVEMGFTNTTNYPALDALNRGNQFYFDAIRVYDPAKGNKLAEAAYHSDGEANNDIEEVRQMLITANTFEAIPSGSTTAGMVYVDSTYTGNIADGKTGNVNVADYAKVGPNNETYLSKGQAVAFRVKANSIPASFDIGAKSITGSSANMKVTVTNNNGMSWNVEKRIASSTVQFIDLLSADNAVASLIYDGAYVVITNTGDGVLSITDIKTAFSNVTNIKDNVSVMSMDFDDSYAVSYTVDANTFAVARMVMTSPVKPEVPETTDPDTTVPETTVPETTVPETTVPETTVPETTVPETTAPETTLPETTAPEITVPETTVPETTVPETTVPETTVPETTVPETTVPETTVPETTVPETTVPETTVPETTAPKNPTYKPSGNQSTVTKPVETTPTEPESTIAETTEPEMPTAYDQETAATEEPEQEQNVPPVKEQPDSFVEQDAPEVQKTVWEMIVDWFVNLIDFIVGLFGGRH